MLVQKVTRSVSEGSSCDEFLAYASGYPKHGPMTKGGAVQLVIAVDRFFLLFFAGG